MENNSLTDYQKRRYEKEKLKNPWRNGSSRVLLLILLVSVVLSWAYVIGFNNITQFIYANRATFGAIIVTALTLFIYAWPIIVTIHDYFSLESRIKRDTALMELSLNVNFINDKTILECSIKNIGNIHFTPYKTAVFIDTGYYDDKKMRYMFPFVQQKGNDANSEREKDDCELSYRLRKAQCSYPKDMFEEFYKNNNVQSYINECYELQHLSDQSVFYIASKEVFREDLVLTLKPNIYRAIMVVVSKDASCDCKCTSVCFEVKQENA